MDRKADTVTDEPAVTSVTACRLPPVGPCQEDMLGAGAIGCGAGCGVGGSGTRGCGTVGTAAVGWGSVPDETVVRAAVRVETD